MPITLCSSLEQYATKTSSIYPKAVQMGVSPSGEKKHQCHSGTHPFSFPAEAGAVPSAFANFARSFPFLANLTVTKFKQL